MGGGGLDTQTRPRSPPVMPTFLLALPTADRQEPWLFSQRAGNPRGHRRRASRHQAHGHSRQPRRWAPSPERHLQALERGALGRHDRSARGVSSRALSFDTTAVMTAPVGQTYSDRTQTSQCSPRLVTRGTPNHRSDLRRRGPRAILARARAAFRMPDRGRSTRVDRCCVGVLRARRAP
jgi:hypothetical protein